MTQSKNGSLQDPVMLDTIDKLRSAGVDKYVSLPMVVAVGGQSSGKSSNLEGLTGLPFPRKSEICTRFVTQVSFRRSDNVLVTLSILPYSDTSEEHEAECKKFTRKISETINSELFSQYMEEATGVILSDKAKKSHPSAFSRDTLKIEICGPSEEHFEVIDVPGLFSVKEEGETTEEDIQLVRSMVGKYMDNPRSIVLAVVPANVDVTTQEIITLAKEADPDGVRTLGILTKPDMVGEGEEGGAMNVMTGKKQQLRLGWSMVRNPGQKELNAGSDRYQLEAEFFQNKKPWNTLNRADVTIPSLKTKLQGILTSHIRREFPNVRRDLDKELAEK